MRIPLSWLREFVSWRGTPNALADRLTMAGLAVEDIEEVGRLDPRVRVGHLIAVEPHPDADRLRVCRVAAGERAPLTMVSGAPGLEAGMLVPVALAGARLANGSEVRAVELRGVASAGVLCSEAELGLGDDASRILLLPAGSKAGARLGDLAGIADTVLTVEVTPNRGDWLSILGVAREVAAVTGGRLRHSKPRVRESGGPAAKEVRVRVEAPALCPRYCARLVRDVRPTDSPLWLRLRLRRAGMRAIDAIVDATNYIMLERGQPLHAFDFARTGGEIVVRRARPGEHLTTLDGVERTLDGDLVIADSHRPLALAGVMGGRDSEVTQTTRAILIESAFFAPATVRRTSRRLGLASQAAYRFERRVDPTMVPEAIDAVAALIARLTGGRVAPGVVENARGAKALKPSRIRLRPSRAQAVLGATVSRAEMARRLKALGARCRGGGQLLVVTPPSYRGDLHLEEDLIEEIGRVGGYDAIPTTVPEVPMAVGGESPPRAFARRVRRLLITEGLSEMVTLSFTDAETNRLLPGFVGRALAPIGLRNPLSSETGELRRSPLVGLVRALRTNLDRGAAFVGAFELGRGYGLGAGQVVEERAAVAILLQGAWPPRGAERTGPAVDFLDLKGVVSNLCAGLGIEERRTRWQLEREVDFLHPGEAARIEIDGVAVGVAGALHPRVAQVFDLAGKVWLAELDTTMLAHYVPRRVGVRALPRFPAVTRDIALIVAEELPADEIIDWFARFAHPHLESVRLFDCYRGTPIPVGKKSLAYALVYRAPDRTLTDDEVNGLHAQVRESLAQSFQLEFRS
jgi:phenylalanyl-tRNA synthetase beta chain